VGQKLPPMRELSQKLGVNHLTVRRGLWELARQGILEIRHGAGTFVANRPSAGVRETVRIALAFRSYMMDTRETHPTVGAFLVGAHRRCKTTECSIQTFFYEEHEFSENVGPALLDDGVRGVVVVDGPLHEKDVEFLRRHQIHAVLVTYEERQDDWSVTLTHDRRGALSQAVEHLRSLGHKEIALISYADTADRGALHRHFIQLAFDHRLGNPDEILILVTDAYGITHWHDVEKFFALDPLPTAVIVNDEFLADVLLDGCERRGIIVPDQLSVVALQDARPFGHRLPLTAVRTAEDISRMAGMACDLLLKRIAGQPIGESQMLYQCRLVPKASSAPPPVYPLARVKPRRRRGQAAEKEVITGKG